MVDPADPDVFTRLLEPLFRYDPNSRTLSGPGVSLADVRPADAIKLIRRLNYAWDARGREIARVIQTAIVRGMARASELPR